MVLRFFSSIIIINCGKYNLLTQSDLFGNDFKVSNVLLRVCHVQNVGIHKWR